ncbi:hypothetical protein R3W88_016318 [Solanum pinnatisectum]|uniref:Uncharacterized protein n=1 Tax=Solanum pinnatisectum TaxID=50273 RepID=A0AAV9L058_9SOLN|nr:hypothetical protein R3W88_016318 [Solanum pinnatisectum]
MGFSWHSWPLAPFNSLGISSILLLPSYVLNYFQKAIIIITSDGMVNLLCSCITNKHTCRMFSLTSFFQIPIGPNFPSPPPPPREKNKREI